MVCNPVLYDKIEICNLLYLAYTDTLRRAHIRERNKKLIKTLEALPGGGPDYARPATEIERRALKER